MNIFILFGITGDLARQKVIPALRELEHRSGKSIGEQLAIGVGRKPTPPDEFKLLQNSLYIGGELDTIFTYKKIKKALYDYVKNKGQGHGAPRTTKINLIAYSSLPPQLHVDVATMFAKHVLDEKLNNKFNIRVRFMFEKPLGTDLTSSNRDLIALQNLFSTENLFFVDHYLQKEPLTALREAVMMHPNLFVDSLGSSGITSIEAIIYENADVRTRGAFYDSVGALNDFGQNHLLQILAECIKWREFVMAHTPPINTKNLRTKTQIISSLKVVNNPIFGQYKGYAETPGVRVGSKTETFFHIEAIYPSIPRGNTAGNMAEATVNIKCILSAGKALGVKKSGLILKDQKHGREFFIDMSLGKKDTYVHVFEEVVAGNKNAFAKESEIIAGWKFVKRVRQIKTQKNIVYESLHDIIGE